MSKEAKLSIPTICASLSLVLGSITALCLLFAWIIDGLKVEIKKDIKNVSYQVEKLDTKFEDHLKYHRDVKDTCDETDEERRMSYANKKD